MTTAPVPESELRECWEDATNAVCQTLQDSYLCKCPDGGCIAAKVALQFDPAMYRHSGWREALAPFAKVNERLEQDYADCADHISLFFGLTHGDFRAASRALSPTAEPAPMDEPRAWEVTTLGSVVGYYQLRDQAERAADGYIKGRVEPLYRRPQPVPMGEPVAWGVKPLEWRDHGPNAFPARFWSAQTPFGFYGIEEESASDSPRYRLEWQSHKFITDEDSLEAAKEAAQRDYEYRISFALLSMHDGASLPRADTSRIYRRPQPAPMEEPAKGEKDA